MDDSNRAALITGCSSGIGRATAARLSRSGWTVYATARRREAIDDLVERGCVPLQLDVTDETSMREAVTRVEADRGAVAALINNAGYSQSGTIEETPVDLIRRQLETNVVGLARLTQLVLPGMRRVGRGRIVNLGSMGGRLTFPGGGYYHATKHALEAFSDALRFEVGGFGIDVVLIQPGLIRTEFAATVARGIPAQSEASPYRRLVERVKEATQDAYARGVLARLGGDPDDVARVIEKAITVGRPKTRYPVTPSAHLFLWQRALLGDRGWDWFLARHYPRPGTD